MLFTRIFPQLRQVTNLNATIFGQHDGLRRCNFGGDFGNNSLFVI
jgi:hypothetical protein